MPVRPRALPLFATAPPTGGLVEPAEAVRAAGFAVDDRPPAPWFNWLFNASGQWIDFLRGPSTARWTRVATGATLDGLDVDRDTPETTAVLRRLLGVAGVTGGSSDLYASARGDAWVALTPANAGFGTPVAVRWTGTRWLVGANASGAGKLWWSPPDGAAGSAVHDPLNAWTGSTLPAGVQLIHALGAAPGGHLAALVTQSSAMAILGSADDGATFTAATLSPAPSSSLYDVVWTGAAWVALVNGGELYRATDAAGTWTRHATTATGAGVLATDGAGTVVALPIGTTAGATWYVSTDHGATWVAQAGPAGLGQLNRLRWLDGAWFLCSDDAPYLATANAIAADGWTRLRLPYFGDIGAPDAVSDVVLSEGALVAVQSGHVLVGARAEDVAPGPWAPAPTPGAALSDAAYLRGRLVGATAPTSGQVLTWDATAGAWTPAASAADATTLRGRAVASTAPTAGQVLTWDATGSDWAPATPTALLAPFWFRLDPTSTAQFGTPRVTTGSAPAVSTITDAAGRPAIRFTANSSNPSFIPLLDSLSAVLAITGAFRVEMRAQWGTGGGSGQMRGIAFNAHATTGLTCYAVTNRSSDGTGYDSVVSGANEAITCFNQLSTDGSFEIPSLWVDVWLDTTAARCTYTYGAQRDALPGGSGSRQRRQTSLATSGGTAVGLYSTGNTGVLDVYELIIWKAPRLW